VRIADRIPATRGDYILALSAWKTGKNPEFLLDLMKELGNKSHLVIAGTWVDSDYKEKFLNLVAGQGLEERVRLVEDLSENDLSNIYKGARVLVHPHKDVGFGMYVLEAAANGCPFVVPSGIGAAEIFGHGVHGFFVQENDLRDYSEHIRRLMKDERLAWTMGKRAWRLSQQYSWDNHAKLLVLSFNRPLS
jgi:D-inositol-3-phosphate glycosyltransferase